MKPAADAHSQGSVLIVDDELINIQVLAQALGDGFDARFATSGSSAIALTLESPPDVILLDVIMPDMDGYEVLRWLKSEPRTRNTPVIFVTSLDEAGDEAHGLELGAVDYVVKPINPAIVRARVRTHVELKRQRDLLQDLAAIDGLTGIANRRRFDDVLAERWRIAQRHGRELTIVLLDVDHFKQYNDNYGHSQGDECLRRVAAGLREAFGRGDDLVARYGGEEFVLLLPGGEGISAATRLLDAIAALELPHEHSSVSNRVTVSAGVLEIAAKTDGTAADALAAADALLYEAKRGGRNRCVVLPVNALLRKTVVREVGA